MMEVKKVGRCGRQKAVGMDEKVKVCGRKRINIKKFENYMRLDRVYNRKNLY